MEALTLTLSREQERESGKVTLLQPREEISIADRRRQCAQALGRSAASVAHCRLQVILQADLCNQLELRLEPVDVLFLGFENLLEELARDIVGLRFGGRDGTKQDRMRLALGA